MKQILILLLAIFPIILFGQNNEINYELPLYNIDLPVDEESGLIAFVYTFNVTNVSQDELFARAENWLDVRYNAVEKMLIINDKQNGELVGNAFTDLMIVKAGIGKLEKMYYTIEIKIEDEKYKCVITDIHYLSYISEYNSDPEIYTAEEALIDDLYKNNRKARSTNIQYKENTILSIQSLVFGLQQAMNPSGISISIGDL
jgi:hypothetical protein